MKNPGRWVAATARWVFLVAAPVLLASCMAPGSGAYHGGPLPEPRQLYVRGPIWNKDPPVVGFVGPGSPAVGRVHVGDTITKIGHRPVHTLADYYTALANDQGQPVTVKTVKGRTETVPFGAIANPKSHASYVLPEAPGDSFVFEQKDIYGRLQESGFFVLQGMSGLMRASVWDTSPKYVELFLEIRVNPSGTDCELKNIGLLDKPANSLLRPVPPTGVVYAVFPQLGETPPSPMPVPAPTVSGYSTTTNTVGTFNGQRYGNSVSGNYTANTTGTTVPMYNYTATDIALAYNLGAIMRQNLIRGATYGARQFLAQRTGNLHLGKLMPGERMTGYVFFAVPANFSGPYIGLVLGGMGKVSAVTFEPSVKQARQTTPHARP